MKIRNGYVSNSSSSSFFMLASSFDAQKVGDAIDSFFDFYELSSERRKEILKEMSDDLDEESYRYEVGSMLRYCIDKDDKIEVRFGNLDNGLEEGKGYFVYYSDHTDDCGYFKNPIAVDLHTYIEYANKMKSICDKNNLEISNLQIINGTASC